MKKFEVVFETPLYFSVFVDAEDQDEAQAKAVDNHFPEGFSVPRGYEIDDNWFVSGIVRASDDD